MKVMTILGTRPEIIRLSRIIEQLDRHCSHVLVHTGQNLDPTLSDEVFAELAVRKPDHQLNLTADSFGAQAGQIMAMTESVMVKERPDRVFILGDTNSGLAALPAKRLGIKVFHLEAGNRCYDDRVPEEVNRRIIDHLSDVLMPYTECGRTNLIREGVGSERIFVVGNPTFEVLEHCAGRVAESNVLSRQGLLPAEYILATVHRAENVDMPERLRELHKAFHALQAEFGKPVVVSTHPRTFNQLEVQGLKSRSEQVKFLQPFGFFDFVALEKNAYCVVTDSGTVQEECCIQRVPNVTIRDVTERPETVESGSNIVSGIDTRNVVRAVSMAVENKRLWEPPIEYTRPGVSQIVVNIVLGYFGR